MYLYNSAAIIILSSFILVVIAILFYYTKKTRYSDIKIFSDKIIPTSLFTQISEILSTSKDLNETLFKIIKLLDDSLSFVNSSAILLRESVTEKLTIPAFSGNINCEYFKQDEFDAIIQNKLQQDNYIYISNTDVRKRKFDDLITNDYVSLAIFRLHDSKLTRGYLLIAFNSELNNEQLTEIIPVAGFISVSLEKFYSEDFVKKELNKIKLVSSVLPSIKPNVKTEEIIDLLVDVCSKAMQTEYVSLFTVNRNTAAIDCESSAGMTNAIQKPLQDLFEKYITDRNQTDSMFLSEQDLISLDNKSSKLLILNGIKSIVASPIRSDLSASGAIIACYNVNIVKPEDTIEIIKAIAAQASSLLSYALEFEQSQFFVDNLAEANYELKIQATKDGLTGLSNHREMQQILSELCNANKINANSIFSVIMVDVDHFKTYNDTHGHQEGDYILRKVARVMASKLRQDDVAARYGGEEFALIFRKLDKHKALVVAERIRKCIAEQSYRKGNITVSMGISTYPEDGTTPNELIEKADKALYHAKITGRNRVVIWGKSISIDDDVEISEEGSKELNVLLIESPEIENSENIDISNSSKYSVHKVDSVGDALEILKNRLFDITIINNTNIPDADAKGLSSLTSIHPNMPVISIVSDDSSEESKNAIRLGIADVITKPIAPSEIPIIIERNIERRRIERQKMSRRSKTILLQAIEALVAAIDAKDKFTAGHSQRVTEIALSISDELGIPDDERNALELAAKLHDIGKIALPDSLLNKNSQLSDEEWAAMKQHPVNGSKIVGAIDELAYISNIIRHHHERLDGEGYPDGLKGPAIPLLSRIIAVADAYEALTSERAYRKSMSPKEAIEEINKLSGKHYSCQIVEALTRCIMDKHTHSENNDQSYSECIQDDVYAA
ncbi:MAG: diguanylate cyclase [Armatimonadota bacterium]